MGLLLARRGSGQVTVTRPFLQANGGANQESSLGLGLCPPQMYKWKLMTSLSVVFLTSVSAQVSCTPSRKHQNIASATLLIKGCH